VRRCLISVLVLLALLWPLRAWAQHERAEASAPTVEVTLASALRWAREQGPGVGPATAAAPAVRDASSATTRLLRAPMLALGGGYREGVERPGPELSVAVSQEIPVADVGRRRKELVSAWREQSKHQIESARNAAALRAALAWAGCLEADAITQLRGQALQQAQAIEQTSRARVAAGSSLPSDAALATSELELARANLLDAEGAVTEAYSELRLATGQQPSTRLAARGDLDRFDTSSVEPQRTREALEHSPALKEARAQVLLARSQTDLLRATQGPSFALGATFLREGTGARVYTAFVSLPLPFVDTAGFEAAREHGLELRARANAADLSRELAKRLALAEHDRVHWREVREALARGEHAAREGLRVLLANYQTGVHDISGVLLARQRVVSLQEGVTRASAELLRAELLLRALTGRLLEGSKP